MIDEEAAVPSKPSDNNSPRYQQIKRFLIDEIRAGRLQSGDRVPSEAEIVSKFGVSRMTANRALRELTAAGLVTRRAGAGTYIADPKPIGHMIQIRNIADEVRSRGHAYRSRVIINEARNADPAIAALLGSRAGTAVFHSLIVHHESEFPIQLEEQFVLAAAAPAYGDMDFHAITPNEYLTRVAPLERVEHRVRARMPDETTRALLGMAFDEPVLVMTRRTWSRSKLVSHAVLTHPADRYELSAAFEVGAG